MTRPRHTLVDLEATSYYHCICRCVRRAFLWGEDSLTGKDYSHREAWVVARLAELDDVFAIEIAAYAVMSNHYHLVLRVDPEMARNWSVQEVITRWEHLFSLPLVVQRYRNGQATPTENQVAHELIEEWRRRLSNLSWYMRCLNEYLARKANEEDNCKGRFWEGRFKSQALLDEAAVLTAMSYVDLNPIRAGVTDLPETSDFTSIEQRIKHLQVNDAREEMQPKLMPLHPQSYDDHTHTLQYDEKDYLSLLDWVGRAVREDKAGAIPEKIPPILARMKINPHFFILHMQAKTRTSIRSASAKGRAARLRVYAERTGKKFIRGWCQQQALYIN